MPSGGKRNKIFLKNEYILRTKLIIEPEYPSRKLPAFYYLTLKDNNLIKLVYEDQDHTETPVSFLRINKAIAVITALKIVRKVIAFGVRTSYMPP